jgi:hypothetical protein
LGAGSANDGRDAAGDISSPFIVAVGEIRSASRHGQPAAHSLHSSQPPGPVLSRLNGLQGRSASARPESRRPEDRRLVRPSVTDVASLLNEIIQDCVIKFTALQPAEAGGSVEAGFKSLRSG